MHESVGASQPGLAWWLRWVVATAIGTIAAFAGFVAIFMVIGEPGDLLFPVLMVGVGGIVGAFQQRFLRQVVSGATRWALATGVGVGLTMAVGVALGERTGLAGTTLMGVVDGATGGAIIGTLQWRVLRPWVSGARWWVPASIAGWALAGGAANAVGYFVDGLDIVVLFVVAAGATGGALQAIIRSAPPVVSPPRPPAPSGAERAVGPADIPSIEA
jgi:hypothetical protein